MKIALNEIGQELSNFIEEHSKKCECDSIYYYCRRCRNLEWHAARVESAIMDIVDRRLELITKPYDPDNSVG